MLSTTILKRRALLLKSATIFLAIAAAIALPQIFHAIGMASGVGGSLGAALLPMHLPVFLAGLFLGPLSGLAVGLTSPILSFWISGMPSIAVLPFMTIELAGYGLMSGLTKNTSAPIIVKLLLAQLAGRLVRAAAIIVAVYGFSAEGVAINWAWNIVLIGLPGIILQWVFVPLLSYRLRGLKRYYDRH